MFGVSKRTWAVWREEKLLRYVKIGQLIFYKLDDIKEFIDNHVVENHVVENNNDNKQHHEEDADCESYIAHIAPNVELKVCKNGNIYKDGAFVKPVKNCNKLYYMYGRPDERRCILVARLVAVHFVPNPCMGRFIGYKDGNPLNVNAENLYWKITPR